MAKINWLPIGVKYEEVKADLGFTDKKTSFGRTPVLEARPFPGDNGGYTRVTTPQNVLMTSVAALKAAGMPENAEEGAVEIACRKGKLTVHING